MGVTSSCGGRANQSRAGSTRKQRPSGTNGRRRTEWRGQLRKDRELKTPAPTRSTAPIVNAPVTKLPLSKVPDRTETITKVPSVLEEAKGSQVTAKISAVKATSNPLKDAAPFGFWVVKKPTQVKGKPTGSGKQKAVDSDTGSGLGVKGSGQNPDVEDAQPPESQGINPDLEAGLQAKDFGKNSQVPEDQAPPPPNVRHISDIPELASLVDEFFGHGLKNML
jgi:hypothetical protein